LSEKLFALNVTKSPFPVFAEVVGCGAPFFRVSSCSAVVNEFAIELEWKHAAIPASIPAMCVHSALAVLCKNAKPSFCKQLNI